MKNALQLYSAATDFVQKTIGQTDQHLLDTESAKAFTATGNPTSDYTTWKNHVSNIRRTFKALATAKLPSEAAAEKVAREKEQAREAKGEKAKE